MTETTGLRERKKHRLRARILAVCEALFRARGFDETTIDDIAAEAEISRQTFFNYFSGKDEVLAELGLAWLRAQAELPRQGLRAGRSGSVLEGARRAIRGQLRAIERDRDFMRLVFTRSGLFFPQGSHVGGASDKPRLDHTRGFLEALAALLEQGQASGEIRSDIGARQAAELYVAVMGATIRLWLIDYWQEGGRLETRGLRALAVLEDGLRAKPKPGRPR